MNLSTDPVVWVAAILTIFIFSFLYKDNPLYKFAEHLVVGTSAAYWTVILYETSLKPKLIEPLFFHFTEGINFLLIIPTILGLLMYARLSNKWAWLSRWPIAYIIGLSAGAALPLMIQTKVIRQIWASMRPISFDMSSLGAFLHSVLYSDILIAVLTILCLFYFYFSKEHKGVFGGMAKLGIWTLMIGFGATFGYTVMARISLLIGRVQFLVGDWLGLLQ